MRIGQKLSFGFLLVTALAGIVGSISLVQLNKTANLLNTRVPKALESINRTSHMDRLAQFIRYYDEILTQSARSYAFTQDGRWKRQYRSVEPKLDRVIKQVIKRGDEKDKEFFSSIDKANLALVEMEHKSIELVNNGQAEEAVKILESREYWNQKEIYERGLRKYFQRRDSKYNEALLASVKTIDLIAKQEKNLIKVPLVLAVIVITLILAIGIGLFITHSISSRLTRLEAAAAEIGEGKLDTEIKISSNDEIGKLAASFNEMAHKLRETHTHFEGKVRERTAELSSANIRLEEKIAERSLTQMRLHQHVKQLNCFYGLSKLIERPKVSLEQICQETVYLIRDAFQYPDITCVRITFDGIRYKTDDFEKSELSMWAHIKAGADKVGAIEVYYLGEKTEAGQGPFLKEERDLLNVVAERLGTIAEHKQTEERLRLFRSLIDRSNDCIFIIDPGRGRFRDVNDRACQSLGYTRKELLDMTLKDIEEPVLNDSSWQQRIKELKLKGDMVLQGWHRRKDATTFIVETSQKYVSKGKEDYILAVARDITERKRAEEELQKVHQELVEASHRAGMAEVATDVLHNVGNVLNSVNVSTTLMTEKVSQSKVSNLKKVADIIEEHADNLGTFLTEDPRGKHIPSYLTKVTKLLIDEQADITANLQSLVNNVEHIKQIVNVQQSYSKALGVEISTSLAEVVRSAIEINKVGLDRHGSRLICEFAELPKINIDKQKVLQILVNLIGNAEFALGNSEKEEKLLIVKIYKHVKDRLRIEVTDNGIGISKENLTKIFRHGFTTKKDGHGFGLHSGALAAKEVGGLLTAHSDGVGHGATFILELPFKPAGITV